jgi:hypothetical protein
LHPAAVPNLKAFIAKKYSIGPRTCSTLFLKNFKWSGKKNENQDGDNSSDTSDVRWWRIVIDTQNTVDVSDND